MKMSISLVVALGMGMAVNCHAGERNTQQRKIKPASTNAKTELDYSSIVLDKDTTITIVSDADGNMIDVQMLQVDGEEAVTVSIMANQPFRKVPRSIDTTLHYQSLLVDDGLTATMITDANGNLIGATVVFVDGENLMSSSTSDNNVLLAMEGVRVMSVGNQIITVIRDEKSGLWDRGAVLHFPTNGFSKQSAVMKSDCNVSVSAVDSCNAVAVSSSCDGRITVYTLCRKSVGGNNCSGNWFVCGAEIYNG